jgi:hypothetical protein
MAYQFLDRSLSLPRDAAAIAGRITEAHDEWLMTDAERATLDSLLRKLQPRCAIEVGVYRAGSLAILAAHCQKIYALDIDPVCETMYASRFANVEFITGPSETTLPELIGRLQATGEDVDFVLIDADHSHHGVRRDINNVLRYRPKCPLYIVMHDSFNPGCRSGMKAADWAANPHAHMLELDFVLGRFVNEEEGPKYREMWCGFALAILLPEQRRGAFILRENESLAYRTAWRRSQYRFQTWWNPFYSIPQVAAAARHQAGQWLRAHAPRLLHVLKGAPQ